MEPDEAFAWQWLLRNAPPGSWNSREGRVWREEAEQRFARLGEERSVKRIDEWFRFDEGGAVRLSKAGGHMLSVRVLYCGLSKSGQGRPALARLGAAQWAKRGRMNGVADGVERLLGARAEDQD